MKKQLFFALALALAPFAAEARDSLGSYTYLEGGFSRFSVDNDTFEDIDIDGGFVRSSVEFGQSHLYLLSGIGYGTTDDNGIDLEGIELQLGLGYYFNVADNVDLTVETVFTRQELEADTDADANTLNNTRVAVGVRGALSNSFEGWVKAGYADGGAYDSDFVGTLGAQFVINENWGVIAEYESSTDISRFNVGVRVSF